MQKNNAQTNPLWTQSFVFLIVIIFSNSFCFQMLNATLALYVEHLVGAASGVSGLIAGAASIVFTVAIIVARPLAGRLMDLWGRKAVMLIGTALLGLSALLNAWIPTVAALIVLRMVQGLGAGTASNTISITTVHVVPVNRLAEGMGKSGLGTTLSMVVGPPVALALIAGGDFRLPFIGVFLCCAVTMLGSLGIRTGRDEAFEAAKRGPRTAAEKKSVFQWFWSVIERKCLAPAMIQFLIMCAFASFTTYLTVYAERRGYSTVSVFFVLASVVMIATQYLFSRFGDKYSPLRLVLPGAVCSASCFLLLALTHSETVFLLCAVFYGVGSGLIMPVMSSATIRGVPDENKSAATATFYVMYDVGLGVGALFWGVLSDLVGIDGIYFGAAAAIVLAALAAVWVFGVKKWGQTPGEVCP